MRWSDLAPAALLLSGVSGALLWKDIMPSGSGLVLVRAAAAAPDSVFAAAVRADAAVIAVPASGLWVLRGDAARIRHEFGLAIPWRGAAGCGSRAP